MPSYTIGSGLPTLPAGLTDKDANLVTPLYRAIGSLAQQLSLLTGNVEYSQAELGQGNQFAGLTEQRAQIIYVKALETITFGALVTLTIDAGKLAVRLATKIDLAKPAHGICNTTTGIAIGSYGAVILLRGLSTGVSGSTIGAVYYLSTAGTMQITKPTLGTEIAQIVAVGLGSAGIYLNIVPWGNI